MDGGLVPWLISTVILVVSVALAFFLGKRYEQDNKVRTKLIEESKKQIDENVDALDEAAETKKKLEDLAEKKRKREEEIHRIESEREEKTDELAVVDNLDDLAKILDEMPEAD